MIDLVIKYTAPIWCNPFLYVLLLIFGGIWAFSTFDRWWDWVKWMCVYLALGVLVILFIGLIYGMGMGVCEEFSWWGW